MRVFQIASLAGIGALALGTPAAAQQAQHFELSGQRVALYNLAGQVTIEAGSGSNVTVDVTRAGADGDQLRIEHGDIGGAQTLRVIYPGDRVVYRNGWRGSTELRVRDDGTFGDGSGWREGRRVRVTGSGDGLDAHADVRVRVPAGQRFAMYLAVGKVSATNVNGTIRLDTQSADATASGMRGDLTIDVGSGDVRLTDAEGDVSLDTGSGNVDATNVRGETLTIDTGSGDVTARDVTASTLEIDTGSGDVEVAGATTSDVSVDTGSGDVRLALGGDLRKIYVDTGSGSVTIRVPDNFSAKLDLETSSGEINVAFPVVTQHFERDHLRGTIGDGRANVTIDTGSGDVSITKGS